MDAVENILQNLHRKRDELIAMQPDTNAGNVSYMRGDIRGNFEVAHSQPQRLVAQIAELGRQITEWEKLRA